MTSSTSSMKWLLAAGGVAGLAVVGVLVNQDDPDAQAPVATRTPAATEPAAAPVEQDRPARRRVREDKTSAHACGLQPGRRFGASFETRASFEVSAGAGQVAQGNKAQTVAGHFAFEVLKATDASATVLVGYANEGAVPGDSDADQLSAPFLARVNAACEVEAFARHGATARETGRHQQSLLHELWFSVPQQGLKRPVTFTNAVGEALGEVAFDERGDLVRTINVYREAWSPDMTGVRVSESTLRVERDGAPWFSRMHGVQRLSVPASLAVGTSTLDVEATGHDASLLASASRSEEDYVWENLLKALPRQLTGVAPIAQGERIAEMKNVTFEQAVQQFGTLVETKARQEEQHLIMAAFLDAHPEHIDEYANALAMHFPHNWKPPGYAALQVTQHAAAKEALLRLFREGRLAPMERVRSSLALAGRTDVGAPLARELTSVAQSRAAAVDKVSVPEHALLHLGVLAGTHADDEEVVTISRETLRSRLQGAQTVRELEMAAQAVGNTGDVSFLPALQTWTEHDDPDMRERVAIGMRRMPVQATRDFVLGWLSRERSFRVKREIFEVMHLQYHDQSAKLDDALIEQTIAHLDERPRVLTRQSIYRLLTPFAKTRPDVRRALREALVLELEKETGQAHFVMGILPQRDVDAALASIESLADQVVANPVPAPAPTDDDDTEDPAPPDDMMGEIGNLGLPDEPPAAGVGAE